MLRSTFAGFSMAQSALLATQRAIDVAGQNISNINTDGYTRQRLDLASITPVGPSPHNSYFDNKVGQGVMMTGIIQIRDPYLDIQFRNQIAKVGTVDSMDSILAGIGNIFDETDSTAIRDALNDVVSQLKTMASTPNAGEDNMDAVVRSSFEVLLNFVNQNAIALEDLRTEVTNKMEDTYIASINDIITQVTELNVSIRNSEVLGSPALELKDRRNSLIDDLATYLPIKVEYKELMETPPVNEMTVTFKDSTGTEHVLIHDKNGGSFDFNEVGPPHTLKINTAVIPSKDPALPDTPSVEIDATEILGEGVLKGTLDMLNKSEVFDETDIRGLGYYEKMFDEFVAGIAETMNYLNAEKDPTTGAVITEHNLFEKPDPTKDFSASNIKIADAWMHGDVEIQRTWEIGPGGTENTTGYENVLNMINALSTDRLEFTFDVVDPVTGAVTQTKAFEGTMQELYDSLQNIQALDRKETSTLLTNRVAVLNQISESKEAVSGVNQDEEVMDLMRFQQSYNAASRLMTTLDEILDKLINSTGVVGR